MKFNLLNAWIISLIFMSGVGCIGAYLVADIWLQNDVDLILIFKHVFSIIAFVILGYNLFKIKIRHKINKRESSLSYLYLFFFIASIIYMFSNYVLNMNHILFSALLCYFAHLIYIRNNNYIILMLASLILGFSGARLTIIYMIFPMLLVRKHRNKAIFYILIFSIIVAVFRTDDYVDFSSLFSIIGVEWRDYFLLFDDDIKLYHPGISSYFAEIFLLPIPGHSLLIDTWDIRMNSIPRLLSDRLNLSVDGLRIGLINEINFLWGYVPMIIFSIAIGVLIRFIETNFKKCGLTPLNISLCFSVLLIIIGQTDVILSFFYPILIFSFIGRFRFN